ncbi:putative Interferon-inducible GTPase 5-like protein [Naja naja]|nr:putative Interferon-inducible GTPase 5-like protein [Naja naja]
MTVPPFSGTSDGKEFEDLRSAIKKTPRNNQSMQNCFLDDAVEDARNKMATELPDYKKHIFTLAVQVFSEDNLMDKKIKMKPCIKYLAFISCVCGAVPVVGLSLACDIGIVMVALKCFWKVLGIDQSSLRFLALQTGKGFEELRSEMKKGH